MYKVVISDPISNDGLTPLIEDQSIHLIKKNIYEIPSKKDIHAIIVRSSTNVTRKLIEDMPDLKIIARAGVGVDNIDIDTATQHGIVVVNAPDGNTISTAEHTFAMMLSMLRKIPQANHSVRNKEWNRSEFIGHEVHGKQLGIIGFGRIGTELAKRALAFHMSVQVYDPFLTKERAEKLQIENVDLEELLRTSDVITVHTPLNNETRGLINKNTLSITKKGAFLLNCARGGIIDENDLVSSLNDGDIAGAAIDVFTEEPSSNMALIEHPNVIATPHIAASTIEAQYQVARQVSEDVGNFLEGQPVRNAINYPATSKEIHDFIYPYVELSQRLGRFLSRCTLKPVSEIQLSYSGDLTNYETTSVSRGFLAGFLNSRVDQPVNIINANVIAKQRGITHGETKASETFGYSNMIEVTVKGEFGVTTIRGTVLPGLGGRVISLNGFDIDFTPKGHLVFITHYDHPGVIGRVGRVLGDHRINIATMQVGRKELGGYAAMVLTFDESLSESVIQSLQQTEAISTVTAISIN
ncbi:phosphoglycerate dehydrogenase [Alkalihalobacillus sp. AL-G]|uniref:phosphoglycerate dehydrogenase n=1 Tax=Alkalihalobacillus sp. AL-G TaxID=2926399 RepID=UPI00272C4F56|nr:phosphoglycerate dehydrogenase [Alkalihalobacillus sp. AL-G]WLD95408.1 phosphoglycerate dehydrogenase [Alkalihalobacillus sp. AL-G]